MSCTHFHRKAIKSTTVNFRADIRYRIGSALHRCLIFIDAPLITPKSSSRMPHSISSAQSLSPCGATMNSGSGSGHLLAMWFLGSILSMNELGRLFSYWWASQSPNPHCCGGSCKRLRDRLMVIQRKTRRSDCGAQEGREMDHI